MTKAVSDGAVTNGFASGSIFSFRTGFCRRCLGNQRNHSAAADISSSSSSTAAADAALDRERWRESGRIVNDDGGLEIDGTGAHELAKAGVCSGECSDTESVSLIV